MALFPRIDSPCPYKGALSEILKGDVCQLCKREVFDLTQMSDGERLGFLGACGSEVCVTYRFPIRAAAAAALAVAAVATPMAAAACEDATTIVVVVGGIKDPANAHYMQVPDPNPAAALPVVYDAKTPAPAPLPATPADPKAQS